MNGPMGGPWDRAGLLYILWVAGGRAGELFEEPSEALIQAKGLIQPLRSGP